MWSVGSGLELGVSLGGYEEGMLGKLAHLHDTSVRGQTGQTKTVFGEDGTIIVVDLVTMTMSLGDVLLSVELVSTGIFIQYTRVCRRGIGFLRYQLRRGSLPVAFCELEQWRECWSGCGEWQQCAG